MKQMHVLLQGAAGFVARSLLPRLREFGATTLTLVDPKPLPQMLVEKLCATGLKVRHHSCSRLAQLPDTTVDLVVCLAGVTDVDFALRYPQVAIDENIAIASDLGEWMRLRAPLARTIFVSTDEVLGESRTPLSESSPLSPTQPYAASKAAAEIILQSYASVYSLGIVILRSCNLIGSDQNARKLIPVAVRSLTAGAAVPVFGEGECLREWLAVEDLCSALLVLADSRIPTGIYHASSGVHLSTNKVIEIVASALGLPPVRKAVPDRAVHDRCYAMSSKKIRAYGWMPNNDPVEAMREAARTLAETRPWTDSDWLLWPELS